LRDRGLKKAFALSWLACNAPAEGFFKFISATTDIG
jgi:hypothetical protein